MALLTVFGIAKKEKDKFLVKEVSFSQAIAQKIAIAGETGSGKTTLLKMIAGLVQPSSGKITFNGERVVGPEEKLIPGHPKIAYLSQHFELRNNYWVYEILEYANRLTHSEADTLYDVCRIKHLLNRKTDQLSGGEKQRIALARLLTGSPELLLLDEPFSNLDGIHKSIIKSVVQDVGEKLKISCIMASHDALDLLSWADSIIVMKDGQIIQQGTPRQIYRQPINEYCTALFSEYSLIEGPLAKKLVKKTVINSDNKILMVRPEQVIILPPDDNLLNGTVEDIAYLGSCYIVKVLIQGQLIKAKINSNVFIKGDKISIALSPGDLWYL
jgi:ABC-type Fe3+/spermidine/putrescine transport system ATPase subunit